MPAYLRAVIGDYLRDRGISYPGQYGQIQKAGIHRGVPQGSGPGAAPMGLRIRLGPPGCPPPRAGSSTLRRRHATPGLRARLRDYHPTGTDWDGTPGGTLGLEVALQKTETVWFARPQVRRPLRGAQLAVEGSK